MNEDKSEQASYIKHTKTQHSPYAKTPLADQRNFDYPEVLMCSKRVQTQELGEKGCVGGMLLLVKAREYRRLSRY